MYKQAASQSLFIVGMVKPSNKGHTELGCQALLVGRDQRVVRREIKAQVPRASPVSPQAAGCLAAVDPHGVHLQTHVPQDRVVTAVQPVVERGRGSHDAEAVSRPRSLLALGAHVPHERR